MLGARRDLFLRRFDEQKARKSELAKSDENRLLLIISLKAEKWERRTLWAIKMTASTGEEKGRHL